MSGRPRRAAATAAVKYVEESDSEDNLSGSDDAKQRKPKKAVKGRGIAKKVASKKRAAVSSSEEDGASSAEEKQPQTKRAKTEEKSEEETPEKTTTGDDSNDDDAIRAAVNLDLAGLKAAVTKGVKDVNKIFEEACKDSSQKGGKNHKKWNEIVMYLVNDAKADVTSSACVAHVICRADNPDLVKFLIDKGAKDIAPMKECPDDKSWYFAAFWDRPLCAQVLLDHKWATMDEKDSKDAAVALERAIWLGNMKMLQFLLDKKVDVNMTISHGSTPLTHAVSSRLKPKLDVDRVKLLLAAGADKTKKDDEGNTPLDIAKQRKKKDLIPLLE